MSLTAKKANYIFKPFNLNIFADKLSFVLWIPGEKRAKLKKISISFEQKTEVGSTIPLDTQDTLHFLSAIAVMQVIFWTEDNFCFIPDCKN